MNADYFFGKPVAETEVKLKIYRRYDYGYWWWYPGPGELIEERRGRTDAEGRWTTTLATNSSLQENSIYTLEAEVTDAAGQPVEGKATLRAYWNTFSLDLYTDKYGYEVDESIDVHVETRTHDDKPAAGKRVTVGVWSGYYGDTARLIAQKEVVTDAQGQATAVFSDLPQGWYRLVANSRDDRGRKVEQTTYLWIFDPQGGSWWYTNSNKLSVSTDKTSYQPGDVAQLLIESRVKGTALLTIERNDVYEETDRHPGRAGNDGRHPHHRRLQAQRLRQSARVLHRFLSERIQ